MIHCGPLRRASPGGERDPIPRHRGVALCTGVSPHSGCLTVNLGEVGPDHGERSSPAWRWTESSDVDPAGLGIGVHQYLVAVDFEQYAAAPVGGLGCQVLVATGDEARQNALREDGVVVLEPQCILLIPAEIRLGSVRPPRPWLASDGSSGGRAKPTRR